SSAVDRQFTNWNLCFTDGLSFVLHNPGTLHGTGIYSVVCGLVSVLRWYITGAPFVFPGRDIFSLFHVSFTSNGTGGSPVSISSVVYPEHFGDGTGSSSVVVPESLVAVVHHFSGCLRLTSNSSVSSSRTPVFT
ncbi:hypothetical protein HAX54_019336, partial [Datura stramonium]|nr:hypothetical protein [Datura stramonium]